MKTTNQRWICAANHIRALGLFVLQIILDLTEETSERKFNQC